MQDLRSLARALGGEVSGHQVIAPGPGHSPLDRSLSVKPSPTAPDGFIVHSHAGDDALACKDYVRSKIGAAPFETKPVAKPVIDKIYNYHDENGDVLFQVVRLKPKSFRQRRPDGKGDYIWNMDGVRRVPYHLPQLLKAANDARPIFICEGEKAVDALTKLGVTATCSPGGAGKWRPEYASHFAGAGDVFIVPDNDEVGEEHSADIMQTMPFARIVRLPGLPEKADAADWIAAGGTADELAELISGGDKSLPNSPLIMRCAADIEPEPIDWIWDGRIARGKLTVIGGDPEEGKSQISVYIAANISVGGNWPNGEGRAPLGSVIILSAEDGAEDTLVPRLIAAGADRSKVHLIEAVRGEDEKGRRTFNLQTDLQMLSEAITQIGDVQAIIIDPASAYMGKEVDSHNDQSVRGVLAPVAEMAHRLGLAIISIMHFNKGNSQAGTKVMHRFMASIAFVAAARVAFAAMRDPEDDTKHLFLHAKNNLAEPAPGLAYHIEQEFVTDMRIKTSRVVWDQGSVSITAAQAMAASRAQDVAPALEEAKQFLAELVGCNGMQVKEIEKEAKEAGLSWATMRRAKDELKLKSERDGYGGPWLWKR